MNHNRSYTPTLVFVIMLVYNLIIFYDCYAMQYTCERCGKVFDRQYNYQRHISKRQRKCTIQNPYKVDTKTLLAILGNIRYPIPDKDIDSIWTTICHVHFAETEKANIFDVIWHFFQNCTARQIESVLNKAHHPRMRTQLLAVYGYIIKLRDDGVQQVCSKPISTILNLFEEFG